VRRRRRISERSFSKLRREQFNLRMARATGQPAKPDQFLQRVRKNIARVKTVLAIQGGRGKA